MRASTLLTLLAIVAVMMVALLPSTAVAAGDHDDHHDSHDDESCHEESHHSEDSDHDHHSNESHADSHSLHCDHHDDHDDHDDHAGHGHGGHGVDPVDGLKGMSIAVITIIGWIVNVLVLAFPKLHKHKLILSLVTAFGGGVFAVVAIAHLLPEAMLILVSEYNKQEAAHGHGGHTGHEVESEIPERFRPAEMVALVGFFVMLFLQRGVFDIKKNPNEDQEDEEAENLNEENKDKKELQQEQEDKKATAPSATAVTVVESQPAAPEAAEEESKKPASPPTESNSDNSDENGNPLKPVSTEPVEADDKNAVAVPVTADRETLEHEAKQREASKLFGLFALFLTLWIHGFSEGVALGIMDTESGVLLIFIAIIVHHWVMDLIFAFNATKIMKEQIPGDAPKPKEHLLSMGARVGISFFCTVNTAIGIAVGWALHASIPTMANGYIMAFSAGTFIFFAFSEVVPGEMPAGEGRKLPQLLAFFLGMGVLYAVLAAFYSAEAHNH